MPVVRAAGVAEEVQVHHEPLVGRPEVGALHGVEQVAPTAVRRRAHLGVLDRHEQPTGVALQLPRVELPHGVRRTPTRYTTTSPSAPAGSRRVAGAHGDSGTTTRHAPSYGGTGRPCTRRGSPAGRGETGEEPNSRSRPAHHAACPASGGAART